MSTPKKACNLRNHVKFDPRSGKKTQTNKQTKKTKPKPSIVKCGREHSRAKKDLQEEEMAQ